MLPNSHIIFRTGVRLATLPALGAGLPVFVACYLLWDSLIISLPAGLLSGMLFFLLVYLSSVYHLKKRISVIRSNIRHTPRKKLNPAKKHSDDLLDEIDLLTSDSEKTRKATHQEFQRMDQTENYRKEFIGDISHELKTPLFTVQGYLETLQSGALDDPEVNYRFLSKAMKNVNRLIYLTEDLMEISKLETEELKPEFQIIPLNKIVRDVIDNLQDKAAQNDITITFREGEANIFAWTDRNQIRQILVNLIENAIKYNKTGGYIYVSTRFLQNQSGKILVSVRDTGIGISKEDINRVTERFFRVDKSRSREQGGTGLGLSIVKHILETHNEKLMIDSIYGKGSTFHFTVKSADHHN